MAGKWLVIVLAGALSSLGVTGTEYYCPAVRKYDFGIGYIPEQLGAGLAPTRWARALHFSPDNDDHYELS
jgi:hypothetical protein